MPCAVLWVGLRMWVWVPATAGWARGRGQSGALLPPALLTAPPLCPALHCTTYCCHTVPQSERVAEGSLVPISSYNTLLAGFVRVGDLTMARAVLDKARREGATPDAYSYRYSTCACVRVRV